MDAGHAVLVLGRLIQNQNSLSLEPMSTAGLPSGSLARSRKLRGFWQNSIPSRPIDWPSCLASISTFVDLTDCTRRAFSFR